MRYSVFSDGASRGNPGLAGGGFVIYDPTKNIVKEDAFALGVTTNNIAEYSAFLKACEAVAELEPEFVEFFLDSELIVKQIKGEYRVRDEKLKPIFTKISFILDKLKFSIKHVPRNENKVADALSNKGADMNRR